MHQTTQPSFDTPEAAESAFYAAFAATDLDAMAAVWVKGAGAICIHPGGGLLKGSNAVLRSWSEIFSGAAPPDVEFRPVAVFETADLVVHLVEEQIRPRADPGTEPTSVLATNIYSRRGDGWRLIEHHASLPLVSRSGKESDQRLLH